MSRICHSLSTILIAVSVVLGGVVASTHSHFSVSSDPGAAAIGGFCPCAAHEESNSDRPINESGTCVICRLIAELQAEVPMVLDIHWDSLVDRCYVADVRVSCTRPNRIFQGRAPPIV